jgi:hypothetical protein
MICMKMDDNENTLKKHHKIKITHVLILFFLIAAGLFTYFRLNLKKELNKRIEAIRAAGYPVTCEELDQWYSIPEDVENSAYNVLDAIGYYKQAQNEESLPVFGKTELPGRTDNMSPEILTLISQYLEDNKNSLESLHKINEFGYGRYPIDLSPGIDTLLPYLSDIRRCIFLLQLETSFFAEENDPNKAADSIKSIINVSNSLSQEPVIISQIVRISCLNRAFTALEYSMNRTKYSDEQLKELGLIFNKSQNISGFKRALVGERCSVLAIYRNPLGLPGDYYNDLPPVPVLGVYKAFGIIDKEAIIFLDLQKENIDAFELPLNKQISAFKAIENKINNLPGIYILIRNFTAAYSHLVTLNLKNIAELNIACSALAVERFRMKNNKLPDSLGNLVPDYLDSVPLDPFDGKEIRYKKLDRGFVTYSIGENQIDDGGNEVPKDKNQKQDSNYDITFIVEK